MLAMLRSGRLLGLIHRRSIATTAGIVVIGDEVLRGDVRDLNAYFLTKNLRKHGVSVKRINFVGDDLEEIGQVVKEFSRKYDYVLTCGGVGPTHDDITYEAIALAFGQKVELRHDMWEMFKMYFGALDESSPLTKFAKIPEKAESIIEKVTHNSRKFEVCMVKLNNIIILPGVPLVTQKLLPLIVKRLGLQEMPEISRELFLSLDEAKITNELNDAVRTFPDVTFGSYPEFYGNYFKTRLRLEAATSSILDEVEAFLKKSLPPSSVLENFCQRPLETAHKRVHDLSTKFDFVREAFDVMQETLSKYKPEEICVGFSGGKDCTVVAFLYHAALQDYKAKKNLKSMPPQNWLYIRSGKGRPEVDDFVDECVSLYGAQMITTSPPYKEALQQAIDKGLNVFLLGNRLVDPKGETLEHFKCTDPGWPKAMRVFPILNWDYKHVWKFIRELYIPYCTLYDQGYSSLGEKSTPNPQLSYTDERGVTRFKPAYCLDDGTTERIGRT